MTLSILKRDTQRRMWGVLTMLLTMILATGLTGCNDNIIYDDQSECYSGVKVKFIYDYHLEPGANAFPANVDCVTVFVFDTDGNYITHFSETSAELRSDQYRMELPLEIGNYELIAYGGVTCEKPTFNFSPGWLTAGQKDGRKHDILVELPVNGDGVSKNKLHDLEERTGGLFYGTIPLEITEDDWNVPGNMREVILPMIKDTNNIRVVLQQISYPNTLDYNDFDFKIIDDNFILDGTNLPAASTKADTEKSYEPYAYENVKMGYMEAGANNGDPAEYDENREVTVAAAEFSTSRLLVQNIPTARLVVTSKTMHDNDGNDKVLIDLPLIMYLKATRSFGTNWIKDDQEYLDRRSDWTMFFFLQRNEWVKTKIVVNDWTVRINDINL